MIRNKTFASGIYEKIIPLLASYIMAKHVRSFILFPFTVLFDDPVKRLMLCAFCAYYAADHEDNTVERLNAQREEQNSL